MGVFMKNESDATATNKPLRESIHGQREYLKPRLIRYGDVAKLTAGSGGGGQDGGGSMTKMCL
jgi:hypothetical protein